MSVEDFSKAQKKSKQNQEKDGISKSQMIGEFARCIHPIGISRQMGALRNIPIRGADIRIVRSNYKHQFVLHKGNQEIVPIDLEVATKLFATALANWTAEYSTKDYQEVAKLALMLSEGYEIEAKNFCDNPDNNCTFEPLIIPEEDVAPVRELSALGWCWKRLDFDSEPYGDLGAWREEVFPRIKSNIKPFMAWIGSLFDHNSPREKYIWIYGGGESGKSTICEAIMDVFGDAAAARNPAKVNTNWFTSTIYGKRLVLLGEATPKLINSGEWKSLTGDDYHEIEAKGVQPRTARIDAKFIITSNDYPDLAGGHENSRRIILVETDRPDDWIPTEHNTKAKTLQRLKEGWPAFLWDCLDEYQKNKRLTCDMSVVHDLQGEDEFETMFQKNFLEDEHGTTTYQEIEKVLQEPRWKVRKFINHCLKSRGVTRGRTESVKFFKGMRSKSFF